MHKNKLSHYIVLLCLSFAPFWLFAQQDAQYTQYMYNTVTVNPAYAGVRGMLSVVGLHRSQWLGIDGAPRTQTLSIHSPIGKRRVALGGSVIKDAIGPVDETYFNIDFAYNIETSKFSKLSFGLKAGGRLFNVNFNDLRQSPGANDEAFANNINNQFNPTVGLGLYYYNPNFYAGLSIPNMLETEHLEVDNISQIAASSSVAKERLTYYFISGFVLELNRNILFKPALLTKLTSGSPLQVDVSANFMFNEKFTVGAAYRWSSAVSLLTSFQISDQLMVGVAYDREITALSQVNDGSFEVLLRFELFKSHHSMFTPRFF